MQITFEKFKEIIDFIKEQREKEESFNAVLDKLSNTSGTAVFIYSDYETKLVDLLSTAMGDKEGLISTFLYYIDAINYPNYELPIKFCPVKGGVVLYRDLKSFYDYLTKNSENR